MKTRAEMRTLPRRRHLSSRGERSESFILTHAARITELTPLTRSLAVSEVEPSRVEAQNKLNLQVSLKSKACGQKRFDSSRGRCALSLIDTRLSLARRPQGPAEASSSRPPIHHFAHENVCGCNLIRERAFIVFIKYLVAFSSSSRVKWKTLTIFQIGNTVIKAEEKKNSYLRHQLRCNT